MKLYLSILFLSSIIASTQTIAISYFDNTSGLEEYNPLSKGLADMLITDLSNVKSIQIVEREKLESLLKEIKLGEGKFMDESTAQKLGKGLGAGYMLTGSYLIMGETMRIDARLVNVGTSEVFMSEEITGKKNVFFKLEKDLVDKLIASLKLELSRTESRNIKKVQTESFESFSNYSSSLDAYDKMEYEESLQFLEKATEIDDDFDLAWEKLEEIESKIKEIDTKRTLGFDTQFVDAIDNIRTGGANDLWTLFMAVYSKINFIFNSKILDDGFSSLPIDQKKELISNLLKEFSRALMVFDYINIKYNYNTLNSIDCSNGPCELEIGYFYLMFIHTLAWYYSLSWLGLPENVPDILNNNGEILLSGGNVDSIIIKRGSELMEKYPYSTYYAPIKEYVTQAINRKKNKK